MLVSSSDPSYTPSLWSDFASNPVVSSGSAILANGGLKMQKEIQRCGWLKSLYILFLTAWRLSASTPHFQFRSWNLPAVESSKIIERSCETCRIRRPLHLFEYMMRVQVFTSYGSFPHMVALLSYLGAT
jgi:hypothetical protein